MASRPKNARSNSARSSNARSRATRRRRRDPLWADYKDDELLDVRIKDLGLRFEGTPLEERVGRLHAELESKGLRLKPHAWLSTEWFSPDGVPGIACPFYLAHPRLMKLERKQMLDVEGGTERECMKILRHEAGHAMATAYRLPYRRDYQRTFGKSRPYPTLLQASPRQPQVRAASRPLVRPEPSVRRLRRDLRRLAVTPQPVASALRRLARAQEARVRGRSDAVVEGRARPGPHPAQARDPVAGDADARRVLRHGSAATTARSTRRSTTGT